MASSKTPRPAKNKPATEVAAIFDSYPPTVRAKLLQLRDIILTTAAATDGVGPITETLKWSEPAYLTEKTKAGSTIRLGWKAKFPEQYAMYFNCQTTLVDTFRTLFPEMTFEGNRALVFQQEQPVPTAAVKHCVELALTYHLNKKNHAKQAKAVTRG